MSVLLILLIIIIVVIVAALQSRTMSVKLGGNADKPTRVYIVRHGETDVNVAGLSNVRGAPEPLNKNGINQAIKTGKFLAEHGLKKYKIYASPAERTVKTARLIAKQLGIPDEQIIKDSRLEEIDSGKFSGHNPHTNPGLFKQYEEVRDKFNKDKDYIDQILKFTDLDEEVHKKFGVELTQSVKDRVSDFLSDIDENSIIVTHSGIMQIMIELMTGIFDKVAGDMSKGKNAALMLAIKRGDNWSIPMIPNTKHL